MFHYTVETELPLEEAAKKVESSLKEKGFGVLWSFNVKDKLQEKGLDFNQNYLILEVCNPKEAKAILEHNSKAIYFLPCKVVLFEDEGKTKIGTVKLTTLMGLVEDESIMKLAEEIEKTMAECIDNSVA